METYAWISAPTRNSVFSKHSLRVLKHLEKQYGVRINTYNPDDSSTEFYNNAISQVISGQAAGIVAVGCEEAALLHIIDRVNEHNIPVVTVDCDVPGSKRLAYIGTDWFGLGVALADNTARLTSGTGKILLLNTSPLHSVSTCILGFNNRIECYDDISTVSVDARSIEHNSDVIKVVSEQFKSQPELAGIIGFDEHSGLGAAMALKKADKQDTIKLLCVDVDEEHLEFIQSGTIDLAVNRNPDLITLRAFQVLYAYNHGSIATSYQSGLINIPGDICIGTKLINKENMDAFQARIPIDETMLSYGLPASDYPLSTLIEDLNAGFVIIDESGVITFANRRLLEMTGYKRDEMIGSDVKKFLNVENQAAFHNHLGRIRNGSQAMFELEWIRSDQTVQSVMLSPSIIFDSINQFKGVLNIVTDISESKKIEKALRVNQEKLRQVEENAHEWIWEVDRQGMYTYSSSVVESILGYKPEELVGKKHFYDLFHQDDIDDLKTSAFSIFSKQEPIQSFLNRNIHKDGHIVWLITSGVPVMDEKGEWIGYCGADIDITSHRTIEEALKDSEKRYKRLFERNLAGVYYTALDGKIIDCNDSFARILGYKSREEILKQEAWSFYSKKRDREEFISMLKKNNHITNYECQLRKKDGNTAWLLENVSLVKDSEGKPSYIQGTIIDISDRKKMEESLRESEEKFRTVVENAHEGIIIIDHKYRIMYINDEMERILGYPRDEIIDADFRKFIHEDDLSKVTDNYLERQKGCEIPSRYEFQVVRRNGEKRQVEVSASIISSALGKNRTIGEIIDITERKKAEDAVLERERFLVNVFEGIRDGICVIDREFNIIRVNPAIEKWFAHAIPVVGKKCYEAFRFQESVCDNCPCLKTLQSVESKHQIVSRVSADGGTTGWFDLFSFPLVDPVSQEVSGVIGYYRDITERIRSGQLQNALYRIAMQKDKSKNLDELYKAMHRIVADVMYAENFYIALFNESDDQISFPYFEDEADVNGPPVTVGKGLTRYVLRTGQSLLCTQEVNDELVRSGEIEVMGAAAPIWLGVPLKVDGETIGVMAVQHYTDPNAYGEREKNMLEFVSNEIASAIQGKRAEKALIESEEKYRIVIENSFEGIFITQKNTVQFCNYRFAKMFDKEESKELLQRDIKDLISPQSWGNVERELRKCEEGSRNMTHFNFLARHPDGFDFEVETLCARILYQGENAIQGVLRDVSEQRRLEAQLRQAQKMEAVGRLAGGIAHDFNNLLTVITGHCEFARMSLSENDPLYRDIDEVFKAADKASTLTGQLLAFSRKQTLELKVVDLNTIITNMDRMLQRLIGEDIELITIPEKDLHKVKADPGQIEEVIVNLAVNSRDAMPKGGKLTIETQNAEMDSQYTRTHPGAKEGLYVMLAVSDTGAGMTEEVKAKVFDPFFTTKGEGIGTGLGLSMIYGIIKQIHGNIWIYSEPDAGTCVKIYLPVVTEEEDEIILKPEYIDVPGGKETILVVEDEQSVRELAVRTLKYMGYKVLDAQNGGEAFLLCETMGKPFDLVITDVIMPKMSGADLVKRLVKMWGEFKVLYMSGYTANVIVNEGILKQGTPYIQKPFRLQALAKKVRDVLDS